MMLQFIYYWGVMLVSTALLSACVESQKQTEEYVNQIKKSAVGAVEKIPPNKQYRNVEYTAYHLRSPFVTTRRAQQSAAAHNTENKGGVMQQPRPDAKRVRDYLEQFPLSSLVMVGTLSKPEMNWGLIKDSNDMIHAVKNGDYVGQNSGKIVAVTPDQIRIIEIVPNGLGGWTKAKATIMLMPEGAKSE